MNELHNSIIYALHVLNVDVSLPKFPDPYPITQVIPRVLICFSNVRMTVLRFLIKCT